MVESWTFRLVGRARGLLQRTITYNRLINSPFSVVGHDDLQAYRGIQAGPARGRQPVGQPAPQFRSGRDRPGRRHHDRHERDLDAQPVPRLGALHDAGDASGGLKRCARTTTPRSLASAHWSTSSFARRACSTTSATRSGTAVPGRRDLLGAADARAARRPRPHLAPLRGQAAARPAHRAAEEPARVLAAAAEPRACTCCRRRPSSRADAAAQRLPRCARGFHYTESQGDELNFFVGTCWHRLVGRRPGAAHPPQARRPDQQRRRAAGGAALHLRRESAERMTTVHAAFSKVAARRGDADFLCGRLGDRRRPTASRPGRAAGARSRARSSGCARAYAAAGYGHGHRVGLLLENRPAFFTHWLALNALGVSIVPIHADMRAARVELLIGHSEMCSRSSCRNREAALRAAAAEVERAAATTIRPEVAGQIPSPTTPARHAREPIGRASECALLYTSGTTGRPKGCRLAQRLLPARRRVVPRPARARRDRPRHRPLHHAAAAQPHERARVLVDGGDALRRLHRPARPLPSEDLVAERAREPRDRRPLPRRDAGDAARGAAERGRSRPQACASASAPASTRATTRRSRSASAFRCSRPGR